MENKTQFLLAQRLWHGPSIIIIRGIAYVTLGGRTSILTKDGLSSKKHGFVQLLYAEESWGVVQHLTATRGARHILFIPPQKRMNVSNGSFELMDVNYASFVQAHDLGIMVTQTRMVQNIDSNCTFGNLPNGRYETTFRDKTNPSRSAHLEIMPYGGILRVRWLGGAAVMSLSGQLKTHWWTSLAAHTDESVEELLYSSLQFVN